MKFTGDSLWKANNVGCVIFNQPFVLMIIHALVSACRQRPLALFGLLLNHGYFIRYKGLFHTVRLRRWLLQQEISLYTKTLAPETSMT